MQFEVSTTERVQARDVTQHVEELLSEETGTATVFVPHTTAGVTVNEAEAGLLGDIEAMLTRLVPEDDDYAHDRIDDNTDAHLRTMLLGSSVTVPVENGSLDMGTWQSILLVESDGPRTRRVRVVTG